MKIPKTNSIIFAFVGLLAAVLINVNLVSAAEDKKGGNEVIVVDNANNEDSQSSLFTKTDEKFEVSDEEFVATNEWQTVKENQAISRGLHVRLNLETGQREAKLLDSNTNSGEAVKESSSNDRERLMSKELEDALKQLNDENVLETTNPIEVNPEFF
jgi:hypothetical protein